MLSKQDGLLLTKIPSLNRFEYSQWNGHKTDCHIHTVYSDGENSMETCVQTAINKGLSAIAFTDHVWRTSDWIDEYVQMGYQLRARYPEIQISLGAEAKALNRRGDIDITPENARKLDFVTGSVHRRLPEETDADFRDLRKLSPEAAGRCETETIIAMTSNSLVNVIGHPMRVYYKFFYDTGKTGLPFATDQLKRILSAVKQSGKRIELNFQVPNLANVLVCYRQSGVAFVLGSDAHQAGAIGNIPYEVIAQPCHPTQ